MSSQAVMPFVIGRAIDRGVADQDGQALVTYAAVMFGIGVLQAVSGIMRHRFAVTNWLTAAYRVVQVVGRQAVHLGGTLPRKVSTGEVVAIGTNDISHIGGAMDVTARFAGAVVSFVLVAVILLQTSTTLGLLVLIGVPLLMVLIGPLLKPLDRRTAHQRHLMGELSNTATDIVGGLRVLRGIGGEQVFHDRYRRESQTTRRPASRWPGCSRSWTRCRCSCPGCSWCSWCGSGARYAVAGHDHARRAGRVLRLLGVPDDPAAHRHRVRQQADPGPGRGRRVCRVLALEPGPSRPRRSGRPPARRAPSWSTCAPGCGSAPGC